MRIPKTWVPLIAKKVAGDLLAEDLVEPVVPKEQYQAAVERLIMAELTIEDKVNDEVRTILTQHQDEMRRAGISYQEMFKKVKGQIARDRKLILR